MTEHLTQSAAAASWLRSRKVTAACAARTVAPRSLLGRRSARPAAGALTPTAAAAS